MPKKAFFWFLQMGHHEKFRHADHQITFGVCMGVLQTNFKISFLGFREMWGYQKFWEFALMKIFSIYKVGIEIFCGKLCLIMHKNVVGMSL